MRPRLRAEHGAPDEDPGRAVQLVRLRRHERHARLQPHLIEARPLRFDLAPSTAFAAVILALHAAAAACAALAFPGTIGLALGCLLVALGAVSAWDRALLRGSRSQQAIEVLASGEGRAILKNRELVPVRPVGGIGVGRHWVALRTGSGQRDLLVAGNMLGRGQFRLLRLWARWGRLPAVAPGQLRR